jgi:hypothetical protein
MCPAVCVRVCACVCAAGQARREALYTPEAAAKSVRSARLQNAHSEPAASIVEADNFQQRAQISRALLGREGRALPMVVYTVAELGVEVS